MTRKELYDYVLPERLIAQYPSQRRDGSRLLVIDRSNDQMEDRYFTDLLEYVIPGDVLIMNDSKVIHARLLGKKLATGAQLEIFLIKDRAGVCGSSDVWEVLARPARRLKVGDVVSFGEELAAQVLEKSADGMIVLAFEHDGVLLELIDKIGKVPLPPYIKRETEAMDSERYQTIYAKEPGSAAAPTAGLHFSKDLLKALRCKGVQEAYVTLHVGLGTFRPVQAKNIEDHHMHEELYHIDPDTAATINSAKAEGRRIICVGTTSVRTLESAAQRASDGRLTVQTGWGSTNLYLYPGGRSFQMTDGLITNFHLPQSTLLMLVSALYDREKILKAYQHAIDENYRFFSYGDAMLIL